MSEDLMRFMNIPPSSPLYNTLQSPNEQGRHTQKDLLLGDRLVYSCTQVCTSVSCVCLNFWWQGSLCSWSKVWLPWTLAMFLPGSALQYRLMRENRDLRHQLVGSLCSSSYVLSHSQDLMYLGSRSCPLPQASTWALVLCPDSTLLT